MPMYPNLCLSCKRAGFDGGDVDPPPTVCEAFPDGVPRAILRNELDHHYPVEGDHGFMFVLNPERESFYEAWKEWVVLLKRGIQPFGAVPPTIAGQELQRYLDGEVTLPQLADTWANRHWNPVPAPRTVQGMAKDENAEQLLMQPGTWNEVLSMHLDGLLTKDEYDFISKAAWDKEQERSGRA